MTNWIDVRVKCPFYKYVLIKQRNIVCEPLVSTATSNKQGFAVKEQLYSHVDDFCSADFKQCPIYRTLNREVYGD